ncbi:MAG: hypothetical protein GWM98_13120, partial [Nitrospinaceae bacterium]|nr:hypothetical protein [Nitrospinaceae bacterium]NIR55241.1 hypothetical protein [Nitrospinaceae bacterium]NIS85675.1 hypothetical protein [Nitrospinaceae bacterium]NIT82520.1 hypothetical protein [Nitrospinaceae bacterium]NIU44725.1 hypothetical protein [Nitrospinaceae bacterium]
FFGAELFNPEELQELAEDYKVFEEIDPFYKGEKKIHYYMFVYPQGTVTDTDFTETFVRSVKRTIRQSGVEKE